MEIMSLIKRVQVLEAKVVRLEESLNEVRSDEIRDSAEISKGKRHETVIEQRLDRVEENMENVLGFLCLDEKGGD